jgi:hypothetical protein
MFIFGVTVVLRPDSTGAFSRRNAKYFACFFWIVSNQVEIIYSSSHNSKETGEKFAFRREKALVESGLYILSVKYSVVRVISVIDLHTSMQLKL